MLSPLYENPPTLIASFMKVSAHLEVAFVFCWIIVADKLNYKTAFVRFLSKKAFVSASKTTYSMYLITPVVVTLICGLTRGGMTYDFPEMVSNCIVIICRFNDVLFIRSFSVTCSSRSSDALPSSSRFISKFHFAIYQNWFYRRSIQRKKSNSFKVSFWWSFINKRKLWN